MNWQSLYNVLQPEICDLRCHNEPLNEREAESISALSLYYCHAASLVLNGKTQFAEYIKIHSDRTIEFVSDDNAINLFNASTAPLFVADSIFQVCDLAEKLDIEQSIPAYDVHRVIELWDHHVETTAPNSILNCQEFTSVYMQQQLADLKHMTQLNNENIGPEM